MATRDAEPGRDVPTAVSVPRQGRGALAWVVMAGLLLVLAGIVAWEIRGRLRADAALKQATARDADRS
jgi:hypothetical protein